MYLGIEIGGTKLQLGVGDANSTKLVEVIRRDVQPDDGAAGILGQIETDGSALTQRHKITRIGIGFGGPVDAAVGKVICSHQIDGWEDTPIVSWCERTFSAPTVLGNDCDAAALAEARLGAGRPFGSMFYVTVGTGVGGGFVVDGELIGKSRPAIAEIGHLRPGLHEDRPDATVESIASGWGIAEAVRNRIAGAVQSLDASRAVNLADAAMLNQESVADLLQRCGGDPNQLTAKLIAQAAQMGNPLAEHAIFNSVEALGWAIGQVITLLAPEAIVVGGGVSLMGDFFFDALRRQTQRYVFPPLANSYQILPTALGELSVVHGAIAMAAESASR